MPAARGLGPAPQPRRPGRARRPRARGRPGGARAPGAGGGAVGGGGAGAGVTPASGGGGGKKNSSKAPSSKASTTRITEREAEPGKALAEAALLLTGALIPAPLADKRGRFCGSNASTGAASTFSVRQTLAASARTNTLSVSTE